MMVGTGIPGIPCPFKYFEKYPIYPQKEMGKYPQNLPTSENLVSPRTQDPVYL